MTHPDDQPEHANPSAQQRAAGALETYFHGPGFPPPKHGEDAAECVPCSDAAKLAVEVLTAAGDAPTRVARGSSVDFCQRWPDEGHSWSWTSHAGEPLVTTRSCGSCGYLDTSEVREQLSGLLAEVERLRAHILDIDAHATPYGDLPNEPGYVGTYLLTAGALHRALGKIGHSAPGCAAEAERDALAARLERAEADIDRFRRDADRSWKLLTDARTACKRLTATLIASAHLLDVPFSNAPDLSPWSRSIKPGIDQLRVALGMRGYVRPPCCDLHNRNCEPPSELCCEDCTEAAHPDHADGSVCIAPDLSAATPSTSEPTP